MAEPKGHIYVLAGTNGAGKSSVGGAAIRETGSTYFNPDEATRQLLNANPGMTLDEANGRAWEQGKRQLELAMRQHANYAFETTLGGSTFTRLLLQATGLGMAVHVWYCGLASPELHIARVKARVGKGGHHIPEEKIRERYVSSREHLLQLIPFIFELYLYDNSAEADPASGEHPAPVLLAHMKDGRIISMQDLAAIPQWAKAIVMALLQRAKRESGSAGA